MDETRFDDLTRALAAVSTRRAGLTAALGGLLGLGMAMGLGPAVRQSAGEAEAKRRKKRRSRLRCSETAPCPVGMICLDIGECGCDPSTGSRPRDLMC